MAGFPAVCQISLRGEVLDHDHEAQGRWIVRPTDESGIRSGGITVGDSDDISHDQAAGIATTNTARDRPLALGRDCADAMLELQLHRRRAADDRALTAGA